VYDIYVSKLLSRPQLQDQKIKSTGKFNNWRRGKNTL